MKLIKLYCNKKDFKVVNFHEGLNIVVGKVTSFETPKNDSHNLGKTKLLELLDFMLLGSINKEHFLKNDIFKDFVFYLEIKIKDNQFLTIQRSTLNDTKISIKISQQDINCLDCNEWDYVDLPLNSRDEEKNPKVLLNKLLNIKINDFVFDYRKILHYFLRNQNDYNDVFKLTRYKGKDSTWKPDLCKLLGFNPDFIIKKYQADDFISNSNKAITILSETNDGINNSEKINEEIRLISSQIETYKDELKTLNFFTSNDDTINSTITSLLLDIKKSNTKVYNLRTEIKLLENNQVNPRVNSKKLMELYEECGTYFPDSLKIEYESLENFNKKIFEESIKYIEKSLVDKKRELSETLISLKTLNEKLSENSKYISQMDLKTKYSELVAKIFDLQTELTQKNNLLKNVTAIDKINSDIINKTKEKDECIKKINELLNEKNPVFEQVSSKYKKLMKSITGLSCDIRIATNKNGNVEFESLFLNDQDVETKESDGNTYKKLMCSSFDISLLTSIGSSNSLNFIYHDGILESLDVNKKILYLDEILKILENNDFQYIISSLECDLPDEYKNQKYNCVVLTDEANGNLFGVNF